jgi:hypothetical protein
VSFAFQARTGPIIVEAEVAGPSGVTTAIMILDTAATASTLKLDLLRSVGYDPGMAVGHVHLLTGATASTVPQIMLNRLSALGKHAIGLRVLAHDLPKAAAADGLIGLDFLRGHVLTVDFPQGQITLS